MKNHKKALIALSLAIITLSSCAAESGTPEESSTNQSNTYTHSNEIIEYYQSEIERLEELIITMKEEFYIAEKQYQASIEELESKLSGNNIPEASSPQIEDVSLLPFSYIISNGEATVVKYMGGSTNVTIPSQLQGYSVTKIGEYAFGSDIESIIISEGIKEIDWFAFSGCTRLVEIYIPLSVTMINYGAFDYCPKSLVIKCKRGSYAEAYAKSYGINCIAE